MRKIDLRWAKKPHRWLLNSAIALSVCQLLLVPESTRVDLLSNTSWVIPSLIVLGALVGITLTNKKYSGYTDQSQVAERTPENSMERNQLNSEIQHYQLIIEREIWNHENIKGWISYELHEDISQILVAAKNHLHYNQSQHVIPAAQIEKVGTILEEAIHKVKKLYEKLEVPPLKILGLVPSFNKK